MTPEDQKIQDLFYSNTEVNDILAFEIIKNRKDTSLFGLKIFKQQKAFNHLSALICVLLTTKNKSLAQEIRDYLQDHLSEKQIYHISETINKTYRGSISASFLTNLFPEESEEVAYFFHKRIPQRANIFLSLAKENHPKRKEVFEDFMKGEYKHFMSHSLRDPGLSYEEFDQFLQEGFKNNPASIFYNLVLINSKFDTPPESLFTKTYPAVTIRPNANQLEFPSYIFKFKGLKDLRIIINSSTVIPRDWSVLSELTELTFEGMNHVFDNFDFVDTLPKLRKLKMAGHLIKHPDLLIRKKTLPIKSPLRFSSPAIPESNPRASIFETSKEDVLSIGGALGKSILSEEESKYYFYKLTSLTRFKKLPPFTPNEILALMNINNPNLRAILQTHIDDLCEKQNAIQSLNKNALLYIAGTPSRKKTEIKAKLKELNIPVANKVDQAITHLVIGKNPKEYKDLQNRNLQIVSEQKLYEIFKADAPGFIVETVQQGDTQITDNILQFLYNDEPANINIGIEMLKSGGVPAELIDPLLIVFKTCPDAKTRGSAKKLLLRHATADLLPLINDTQRFTNLNQKVRAQEINKKLEKIASKTSKALAAKLSLLLHGRFKKGLRYILYHFHEPCTERTLALQAMTEDTHFDFATGLGFTDHHGKSPQDIWLTKMKTPAKFPADVVKHVELIETANFHNCKLTSLPKNIGDLKDLKELDLSYNFLGSIPKSIEEMTKLEKLDLKANGFKSFPSTLKRLTNLKVLDLRFNMIKNELVEIEIPEDVKVALAGCEILV